MSDHGHFCPKKRDRPLVLQTPAWPLIVSMAASMPLGWWKLSA